MKRTILFVVMYIFLSTLYLESVQVAVPFYGTITLPDPKISGAVQAVDLPNRSFGSLNFTQVQVKRDEKSIVLTGTVDFYGTKMHAEYEESFNDSTSSQIIDLREKGLVLTSLDKKPLVILNIALDKVRLLFNEKQKTIIIVGTTSLLDLILEARFIVALNLSDDRDLIDPTKKISAKALFSASLLPSITEWAPFKDSGIKELADNKISNLKVGIKAGIQKNAVFDGTFGVDLDEAVKLSGGLLASLVVEGSLTMLYVTSNIMLDFGYRQGSGWGIIGFVSLPEGWKLSQSFPALFTGKDPVTQALDLIKINNPKIIVTTYDTVINQDNESIKIIKGLNVRGELILENRYDNPVLESINQVIKKVFPQILAVQADQSRPALVFEGVIPPDIKNLVLSIGLASGGFGFKMGPVTLYNGGLDFVIRGDPAIGFEGSFLCKPTEQDEPLDIALELLFAPLKFGVAGSVKGIWKNPFGIKGFEFGNLGLQGTQTYTAVAEALTAGAATAGVGALVGLLPADIGMAGEVKLGAGPQAVQAQVRVNLGKDVANIGIIASIVNPITLPNLIDIILTQGGSSLKLTNIIPIQCRKASVHFVPLGTRVGAIKLDQGVGFSVYCDFFGKEAYVEASVDWQKGIILKGKMARIDTGIFQFTGSDGNGDPQIDSELSLQNQQIKISGQIVLANFLKSNTHIDISSESATFASESSVGPVSSPLLVRIKGKMLSLQDIGSQINPQAFGIELEFENQLTDFINREIIKIFTERKDIFERDLNELIRQVAYRATQNDIAKQEQKVRDAENNRVWFVDNPALSIAREAEVTKEKVALELLKAKYAFDSTDLGKAVRSALDALGLTQLIANALTDIRNLGVATFDAGKLIFNDISKLLVINKIYWQGTLANLENGTIPGVTVECTVSGKSIKRTIDAFDLKNPFDSGAKIAQQYVTLAIDGIKAQLNI